MKRVYADLKGQVAVITGGSSGIGAAIVERLAQEHMKVVINYHTDKTQAQALAQKIQQAQGQALVVQGDVSQEPDVDNLLAQTLRRFGQLDLWVNNAGVEDYAPTHQMTLKQWQRVIDINLNGLFLGSMVAVNQYLKQGNPGRIINVSSVHERIPWPGFAHYAVSKGGGQMFTKTIALEYAKQQIRVNAIAPGAIDTPINKTKFTDPQQLAETLELIPMQRVGHPQEVAAAAAWLASQESSYMTGATIFIDGGMTLYPQFAEGKG